MSYKNLLVQMDQTKASAGRVEAAITLAKAQQAYLTGLYVINEPDLPGFVKAQLPRQAIEEQRARANDMARTETEAFQAKAERNGVKADTRIVRVQDREVAALFARHGRYADLVIDGQAEPDHSGPGGRNMVADLVFSAGRPVLVIPYIGANQSIGQTITVAWDAGREAARAVADAMPLMERAARIDILIINPQSGIEDHGPEPGADIALSLARHDIKVEVHTLAASDIEEGDAILSWLSDSGSDLLVMGLYGHARLREFMLGGVSRRILHSMTIPVLLAH